MRALILNDTRRGHHLGCIFVMQQLEHLCGETGMVVAASLRPGRQFQAQVLAHLPHCDVVIINGEGTMHHDAPGAMAIARAGALAVEQGVPVALINTVWQDNMAANDLLGCCQWIATRESLSQAEMAEAGYSARVVPDLLLSTPAVRLFGTVPAASSRGIVVMDDVRVDVSIALAQWSRARGLSYLPMGERPSLRMRAGWTRWMRLGMSSGWARQFHRSQVTSFAQASLVVTGRFHGVCLAMLAGRPFVAFASNTHKIEGLVRDAGLDADLLLSRDPPADPASRDAFIDAAVQRVQQAFANPEVRTRYEGACRQYAATASAGAIALFRDIRDTCRQR